MLLEIGTRVHGHRSCLRPRTGRAGSRTVVSSCVPASCRRSSNPSGVAVVVSTNKPVHWGRRTERNRRTLSRRESLTRWVPATVPSLFQSPARACQFRVARKRRLRHVEHGSVSTPQSMSSAGVVPACAPSLFQSSPRWKHHRREEQRSSTSRNTTDRTAPEGEAAITAASPAGAVVAIERVRPSCLRRSRSPSTLAKWRGSTTPVRAGCRATAGSRLAVAHPPFRAAPGGLPQEERPSTSVRLWGYPERYPGTRSRTTVFPRRSIRPPELLTMVMSPPRRRASLS